jgi:hypothetical protein
MVLKTINMANAYVGRIVRRRLFFGIIIFKLRTTLLITQGGLMELKFERRIG